MMWLELSARIEVMKQKQVMRLISPASVPIGTYSMRLDAFRELL